MTGTGGTPITTSAGDVGSHTLTVTATDTDGRTTSTSVTYEVIEGPPVQVNRAAVVALAAQFFAQCPKGQASSASCQFVADLIYVAGVAVAPDVGSGTSRGKHRPVVLGKTKVTIPAGHSKRIRIKLDRAGRRLLFKRHVLKVTLLIKQAGHPAIRKTLVFRSKR